MRKETPIGGHPTGDIDTYKRYDQYPVNSIKSQGIKGFTDAKAVTFMLGGRWQGSYGIARCPAHDDRTPSMQISQHGDRPYFHCHAGCDWRSIKAALIGQGILAPDGDKPYNSPCAPPNKPPTARPLKPKTDYPLKIWQAAKPIKGTLAEAYLHKRGIILDQWPASLRFHDRIKHHCGGDHPALIACFASWPHRKLCAIQRIYLDQYGNKASLSPVKMTLGTMRGAAIRLSPWQEGQELVLCEGLEDGLSILWATNKSVWVTGGTSNMKAIMLPPPQTIQRLIYAADNDKAGREAAQAAADHGLGLGYNTAIALPPEHGKDWNDIYKAQQQ